MLVTFPRLFILISIMHLALMATPIMKKMVVELNIKDANSIKVQLVPLDDPTNNDFVFVETDTSGIKEEVDTKFISDKTQKVDNETVSHQNKAMGKKGEKNDNETKDKKDIKLKDLSPDLSNQNLSPNAEKKKESGNEGNLGTGENYPVFDEEINEGDKTSLNTIEFKYASFYKRMKEQVGNAWIPMVTNLSSENLAAGSYKTRIILKLSKEGEIIGLKLDASSNNQILDDIAYRTFTKVRIFPNPPADLFNGKEYLYIPWTLELRN